MKTTSLAIVALLLLPSPGCREADRRVPTNATGIHLRVGHFPNVTHAQALVAHALTRQGRGWFEERLGKDATIEWYVYNAGPSAMEAIFAESLDMTYVGPNPALNAFIKSNGEEIRVIAGAAVGGAALVVHAGGAIRTPADFRGKTIGTPQLGNTQDIACRAWLTSQGYRVTQLGGDVIVLPTSNPDQLGLFASGKLDAVWTVEPWVSILEMEAGAAVYLEETDAITTLLVARASFLEQRREIVRGFAAAHAGLTRWIVEHPVEARELVAMELKAETSRSISPELLERTWKRLVFTSEISLPPLAKLVEAARAAGFVRTEPDLTRLVEIPW